MSPQPPQQPYPPQQYPAAGPQPAWKPAAPPPKRSRGPRIVLIAVLVVVGLAVAFIALGALVGDEETGQTAKSTATTVVTPAAAQPAGDDEFAVTVKVVDQACGASNCRVTWVPVLIYDGPLPATGESWTVSYKVVGAESGTSAGKILIGPKGPAKQNEKRNRVAEGGKITLQVTGVER
ncbi:hypothetical protein [Actinoplanes lobatus]|uniref:Uncharacterized protein n=1 Tax=Actinoplanes lobatus TaxID=113568 RepID=A0A7W7HRB8_9ACTN|nr:hypothetical protein [Actinoplanes lobatus]MBB4755288.1 hypothetical protein [Actinoplanes lobatus]GIE46426.1 hypothetical protein Alo02nite_93240 [Actinoplanes lobatus]